MDGFYVLIFLPLAFCFMEQFIKALRSEDRDKTPSSTTLASICFALMMLFFALLINSSI